MSYLRSMLFNSEILGDFPHNLTAVDFLFNSFVVGEQLHDLNALKFIETCFIAQNMVYLGECPMYTPKDCIF